MKRTPAELAAILRALPPWTNPFIPKAAAFKEVRVRDIKEIIVALERLEKLDGAE